MIAGGDEFSRSQRGNNNCYCQDNELTWFDWDLDEPRKRLLDFTARLIQLRLSHPNLHRRKFFQDREIRKPGQDTALMDIAWFNTDGNHVSDETWHTDWNRAVCVLLNGQTLEVTDENGEPVIDHSFLLIINAAQDGVEFTLPSCKTAGPWRQIVSTENIMDPFAEKEPDGKVIVGGRSLLLFIDKDPVRKSESQ
jgi:glycogen operon protein